MPDGSGLSKHLLAEYLLSAGDRKLAGQAFGEADASPDAPSPEAVRRYQSARDLARNSQDAFEQLVKCAPDSWEASVFLGDVDRQHGDLVNALAHYQKAAGEQPNNAAPLLGLGTVYWEMGDFDRAYTYLEQTLAINPGAKQAIFELANIAVRRHQDAEAILLLQRYLVAQPDALAARADLGRAYFHVGRFESALREFAKAASSDERGDLHYEMSIALRKLGRIDEADTALKQSTALREAQAKREQRLHSER